MPKRDHQNLQILPRQLTKRDLQADESSPLPESHLSSHPSNPQHPAWPGVTYLQSPPLGERLTFFLTTPNDLHPPAAPKGLCRPGRDARCGEMQLPVTPAAGRLRTGRREPCQSSTATDEKALSLLGRVSNLLEKA